MFTYEKLEDPTEVLQAFEAAHGPEKIKRCYFTPMRKMEGETAWVFYNDDDEVVAWGGMREIEPGMRGYRLGVFPAFERQGWRLKIRDWLCDRAFADPSVHTVRTSCQVNNPPQVVRMLNAHIAGTWMEFKYATPEPPTLWFHLTRERWNALSRLP